MEIKVVVYNKKIQGHNVLTDINLTLNSGHIYSFVGRNGSGKTMLLRAISGLILPTDGEVYVDDQKLGKDLSFPNDTGIFIDEPRYLSYLTGFENLQMLAEIRKKISDEQIKEWMEKLLLPINKLKFRKYSAGMKQKVGIIQALMEEPKLLILDEPFNTLDEESVIILKDILIKFKQQGALIIITSHNKEDHEQLSDQIFEIKNGILIN